MTELHALVSEMLRDVDAYTVPSPADAETKVKLDANESPYPFPPEVRAALAQHLAGADLHRYPDPYHHELRDLVASELEVAPGRLAFGHGSNELVIQLCLAFGQPRDGADRAAVLYPAPTFVYYRSAALAAGVEPFEVDLTPDFQLDADMLAHGIGNHRPNIIFFARPNNPTGTLWSREVIEQTVVDHSDTLVVVDEAYIEFGGDSFVDLLPALPNLVLMRTFSKVGMAGLRIGYLAASPEIVGEIGKVCPPYNIGVLHQRAAEFLLANYRDLMRQRAAAVVAERDRLFDNLSEMPHLTVFESAGNMLLLCLADAEHVWRELGARGIRVRRFAGHPRLDPYLRVTVGTPEENELFLAALHEILG